MSNYLHFNVRDEITYPLPNFTNVKLAPDSPASYSRIWGWRIWCQLHVGPNFIDWWVADLIHFKWTYVGSTSLQQLYCSFILGILERLDLGKQGALETTYWLAHNHTRNCRYSANHTVLWHNDGVIWQNILWDVNNNLKWEQKRAQFIANIFSLCVRWMAQIWANVMQMALIHYRNEGVVVSSSNGIAIF